MQKAKPCSRRAALKRLSAGAVAGAAVLAAGCGPYRRHERREDRRDDREDEHKKNEA